MGRFSSPDPFNPVVDTEDADDFREYLGQPKNWNRYVYVWNNPLRFIDPNGERVFVVLYTEGNTEGDAEFKLAAETQKADIEKSKGFDSNKDTVVLLGVKGKGGVQTALNYAATLEKQYGKIEQLAIFSHSGRMDGPLFEYGTANQAQFTSNEMANLRINWDRSSGSANGYFAGCNTANFCQNFADAHQVPAFGFDTFASFSSTPVGKSKGWWVQQQVLGYDGPLYLVSSEGHGLIRRDPAPKDRPRR